MKLIAYSLYDSSDWPITIASPKREWMTQTPGGFAYRCLPLTIANQAGWVIGSPACFTATWNGTEAPAGSIDFDIDLPDQRFATFIHSHFGSGIITFSIPYLFRTPPEIGLLVRGLPNHPKFNLTPLEGFVETDWATQTFTMNWKIDRASFPVSFAKGEPICFLQPFGVGTIEEAEPEIVPLSSDPVLKAEFDKWSASRLQFNADPMRGGKWQKEYHQGAAPAGIAVTGHRTKLQLREFVHKPRRVE